MSFLQNIKKEIQSQFDAACDATQQDGEHNLELKSQLALLIKSTCALVLMHIRNIS